MEKKYIFNIEHYFLKKVVTSAEEVTVTFPFTFTIDIPNTYDDSFYCVYCMMSNPRPLKGDRVKKEPFWTIDLFEFSVEETSEPKVIVKSITYYAAQDIISRVYGSGSSSYNKIMNSHFNDITGDITKKLKTIL